MSYVPFTDNVGVNLLLNQAAETTTATAPVAPTHQLIMIAQSASGTTITISQVPEPVPPARDVDMFPFVCFMVGILGLAILMSSLAFRSKIQRLMMIAVGVVWSLTFAYVIWS